MEGKEDLVLGNISLIKKRIDKKEPFPVRYEIIPSENGSKKTLLFYPGWGASSKLFIYLAGKFKKEYNVILFDYPLEVLSPDTQKTIRYFKEIREKTKEAIDNVGAKDLTYFGTSLGGYLAAYISNAIRPEKMIIVCSGSMISDTVWTSISGKDIKEELKRKGFDLPKLRREWEPIEPINCIGKKFAKGKVLFYSSKNDKLVLYPLQKELLKKLSATEIEEKVRGHYFTILKSLKDYQTISAFLSGAKKDD